MRRRAFISGSGVALAGLAGCLQIAPGWRTGERTPTDDGTPDADGPGEWRPDPDELSIGGRVVNAAADARTFDVRIRDGDEPVYAVEIAVGGASTRQVHHWGIRGGTRTVTVTVDGATAVETLSFDVEPTGTRADAYVDVVYTPDGTVDVGITPSAQIDGGGGHPQRLSSSLR